MNITIIGSGVYGQAIAKLLLTSNKKVTMWTENENPETMQVQEGIELTNSYEEATKNANFIFLLTGSKFIKSVMENMMPYLKDDTVIILGSKGILEDTRTPLEVVTSLVSNPCAVLSGPTFAKDIEALDPVGFTLAAENKIVFDKVAEIMPNTYLEFSGDLIGIELAGSLKNAYAIGNGIVAGLNYGFSTSCLYITKVIHEMEHIFDQLGGNPNSIKTLAGLGDTILTCTSKESRNFSYGYLLSSNKSESAHFLDNNTVEGYENLKSFVRLFEEKKISAPILTHIFEISSGKREPSSLLELFTK